jgi:hypothetical protein
MRSPAPTQVYQNVLSDSTRWAHFEHRPGDVFVCTPPKCGTTWTQAICVMLVFGTTELDANPAEISPWFDLQLEPLDEVTRLLDAQRHRRIIKTHTPFDGIPWFEDADYVCVYRDPRDAFFSLRNHIGNMKMQIREGALDDPDAEAFRVWLDHRYTPPNGADGPPSLSELLHHFESFRAQTDLPNLGFYHYADLSDDPIGEIGRIARQLRIEASPDLVRRIAEATDFENMRRQAERFAPGASAGMWRDTTRFFNKGTSGQWREVISVDDDRRFHEVLAKRLPESVARWLIGGRSEGSLSG